MAKRIEATPERIAALPEWAREHIQHLERKAQEAKKELNEHLTTNKPSEFAIRRYGSESRGGNGPELVYLPPESTIVAFLDQDHKKDLHYRKGVELRVRGPWSPGAFSGVEHLEVSSWHSYPMVTPQAANVLRVRLTEDF
jgi:hypothetical protein